MKNHLEESGWGSDLSPIVPGTIWSFDPGVLVTSDDKNWSVINFIPNDIWILFWVHHWIGMISNDSHNLWKDIDHVLV